MMFRQGPEESAAQQRLDDAQRSGQRLTQAQAELLSDDVWTARARDHASRRAAREGHER